MCPFQSFFFQVEGGERVDAGGRIDGDGDHGGGGSSIWSTGKKIIYIFFNKREVEVLILKGVVKWKSLRKDVS